jgi:hypothetical protein
MTLLHFIWINATRDFGRGEYAAMFSILDNTSYDLYLHTNLKEGQVFWDPYTLKKNPRVKIIYTEFETEVNGVSLIPAHISDLYRLRVLHDYGGIYSDLDILWLRDLPVDVSENRLVVSWENQAYRTVNNGMFCAQKGDERLLNLMTELKSYIKPSMKYLTLFKPFTSFLKQNMTCTIPQRYFYLNSFRRLGRSIKEAGGSMTAHAAKLCTPARTIPVHFKDVVGFHWYSSLYSFDDVVKVPAVTVTFGRLLNRISQIPKRVL